MSVAAKSAVALDAELAAALAAAGGDAVARRAAAAGLGPAFHRRLVGVVRPAWMLATAEDFRCGLERGWVGGWGVGRGGWGQKGGGGGGGCWWP